MARLDILAYHALDGDRHLLKVSNDDLRSLIHGRLAARLSLAQIELYDKLLRAERTRYIALENIDDSIDDDHGRRYERYRKSCGSLARACARETLEKAGVAPSRISAIVTNTTVGGMVPNLSSQIGNELGVAHTTRVLDLGYMGCATALLALEVIESQLPPGGVGLIVSAELTSAMTNLAAGNDASLVANTVFGDGVGAFLVARRPHGERAWLRILDHAGSFDTSDEALSAITYEPNSVYHEIRLHETIQKVAVGGVGRVIEELVRRRLATYADKCMYLAYSRVPPWEKRIDYALLHTAGRRILEGLIASLRLSESQSAHNLRAFQRYSNTSSASLYYALDELARGTVLRKGQRLLFLGYGSGFLTRGCLAEVVA